MPDQGRLSERKPRSHRASVLAVATVCTMCTIAAAVGASTQPIPAPLLPNGGYALTLTPASVQERALGAAQPITVDAQVAHFAEAVTVLTSDGITLHGASSATHLKASGAIQRSTLTLELGGSGTNASGTFLLAAPGGQRLAGTATVAPQDGARRTTRADCSGFWGCVTTIGGVDWRAFGN